MIKVAIRIVLSVLLFLLAFGIIFIMKKIKSKKQGIIQNIVSVDTYEQVKDINKKNKRIAYIILASVFAITLISFYPFEGEFIRFNTPEDSLNYSIAKSRFRENTIIEGEGCYFVVSRRGNNVSYHSISKYGNKVGMANYKSERKYLGRNISSDHLVSCRALYDKNSDSSCYFIAYFSPIGDEEENIVLINGQNAECVYYYKNAVAKYALVIDGKFEEDIVININGVDKKITPAT